MEKKTMMRTLPSRHEGTGAEAERRLRRVGPVTLGLTIPRRWIQEWKARPGLLVKLHRRADGAVVIRLRENPDHASGARIDVDPTAPDDHLLRHLVAAYIRGAPRICVEQRPRLTPAARQVVQAFLQRTVQTAIVEESVQRIVVQDVTDTETLPLVRLLTRLGALVVHLHRRAAESNASDPSGFPIDWERLDDEVDRYAWLIERRVRQKIEEGAPIHDEPWDPVSALLVARALERAADHAVQLGDIGARLSEVALPEPIRQSLADQHSQLLEVLQRAVALLPEPDVDEADQILDAAESIRRANGTIQEGLHTGDSAPRVPFVADGWVRVYLQSLERTAAYTMDVAEVVLDSDLRGPTAPGPPPAAGAAHSTHPVSRVAKEEPTQ